MLFFFFSSRRRHTRCSRDWSSDVCSSDLADGVRAEALAAFGAVKEFRFPNAVLEVPREDAAATSARLLAALPVADLSIEDPPIEDVIRVAFARGVEENE